jgi:hypothetical protein
VNANASLDAPRKDNDVNTRTIAYWATLGLFSAVLGFSGIAHTIRAEAMVEGLTGLGYPVFVLSILGPLKLAGVITRLLPGLPLLKEWAYAGFTFNLIGATASHAFAGDPIGEVLPPAVILCVGLASYFLRPADRRLPSTATAPVGAPA